MSEDIQRKINTLRDKLNKHNYNYYVLSEPTIEDYDFDMKLKELKALEESYPQYADSNSPTARVGSDLNLEFKQIIHKYPMLSLGNTYNEAELLEFDARVAKGLGERPTYVCELKFDGASISLQYNDGRLLHAVTRGDGEQGNDVTNNVRTIKSIPLVLKGNYPQSFEIRGEVVIPFSVFEALNVQRQEQGDTPFANPRNAASGSLKMQNSSEAAQRNLDAYLYYVLSDRPITGEHYKNLQEAKTWGFKISEHSQLCENMDEVIQYINTWDLKRKTLPVPIDGIVIKVNSIHQQEELGLTSKTPRWAISYKYKAERVSTLLESISYQVGRTGAITPVANLQAVQLAGTVVKRASLHNENIMQELDLHLNDRVFVEKGGEIIPKIVGVDTSCRASDAIKVQFISHCPSCGTSLVKMEGEAAHYCSNEAGCMPQQQGKVEHFISRKAMNIDGLGAETVDLLFKNNCISNIADLYNLKKEHLHSLDRMGDRSAQNILEGIQQSLQVPYERVLFGLGIRFVGQTVAKKLATAFVTVEALRKASLEELVQVDEIGERIAMSVIKYFQDERNCELIYRLKKAGLQMEINIDPKKETHHHLDGQSFVISGTFSLFSRDELKQLIESNGGRNSSSISSKTDYLIAGNNIGPAKLQKAQTLKLKIIDEIEFTEMIKKTE